MFSHSPTSSSFPRRGRGLFACCLALALLVGLIPSTAQGELDMNPQIDALVTALEGKRVGLLTNYSAVDQQYRYISDRLAADPDVDLVAFFAPEHGLRGEHQAGDGDPDYTDPLTGLPVFSLYGSRKAPTPEQLEMIDVLVFDIQDVGSRFYTYVWSMTYAMEAAAAHDTAFVVFDRPNPIGLDKVEGVPNPFDAGLIGRKWAGAPFGVATRHGMTAGEIALLVNNEWMDPKVDLQVVAVPGLTRAMSFDETGYPWVFPSPNMPTIDTALVYPGMCALEGANASEGRGTTRPFELTGAPFIDPNALAEALNAKNLPGVRFRPASFTPTFDNFAGQVCHGVQVHVTDASQFQAVRTGLEVVKAMVDAYPEQITLASNLSRLMGVSNLHERIRTESVDAIMAEWTEPMAQFMTLREKHLIYPESGTFSGIIISGSKGE